MKRLLYVVVVFAGLCHSVSKAGQCTTGGKFPNDAEPDCRGYIFCIFRGSGIFVQYNLSCPPEFVFSPLEQICTNVTTYRCSNQPLAFTCLSVGSFDNPASDNCSNYIACVEGVNNTVTPRLFDCPTATVFSPENGTCVNENEYKCVVEPEVADVLVLGSTEANGNDVPESGTHHNGAISFGAASLSLVLVCLFSPVSLFCRVD